MADQCHYLTVDTNAGYLQGFLLPPVCKCCDSESVLHHANYQLFFARKETAREAARTATARFLRYTPLEKYWEAFVGVASYSKGISLDKLIAEIRSTIRDDFSEESDRLASDSTTDKAIKRLIDMTGYNFYGVESIPFYPDANEQTTGPIRSETHVVASTAIGNIDRIDYLDENWIQPMSAHANWKDANECATHANANSFRTTNPLSLGDSLQHSTNLAETELNEKVSEILGTPFQLPTDQHESETQIFPSSVTDEQMLAISELFTLTFVSYYTMRFIT